MAHDNLHIVVTLAVATFCSSKKVRLLFSSWKMTGLLVLCVFAAVFKNASASTEICTNTLLPGAKGNTRLGECGSTAVLLSVCTVRDKANYVCDLIVNVKEC